MTYTTSAQYPLCRFFVRSNEITALVTEDVLSDRLTRRLEPETTGVATDLIGEEYRAVLCLPELQLKIGKEEPPPTEVILQDDVDAQRELPHGRKVVLCGETQRAYEVVVEHRIAVRVR